MWALNNRTPYAAERNWTRGKQGEHYWVVAVKATFDIARDGRVTLADEQLPPVLVPEYYGQPGASSLRYDSDLLMMKPTTDVIVNAHAHAPRGKPAPRVDVSLRIAGIHKVLRVTGMRHYARTLGFTKCTAPEPFTTQPIHYEWAYGGIDVSDADPSKHRIDARNPIGKSFAKRRSNLEGKPAHSVEYPSGDPAKMGPASFGAIDRSWSPRRELAGTYDETWAEKRKPLLPDDYDDRFALCSPADQRPAKPLRGGEQVVLVQLTPDGTLRIVLPRLDFAFTTLFGSRREEHDGTLTSVIVEPEEMRLMMVWQTALRVSARQCETLDHTLIVERPHVQ